MRTLRMLVALGLVAVPVPTLAQDVIAGNDFLATDSPPTYQNFIGPYTIPVGFFGPGSDPFTGHVQLKGVPLVTHPVCGAGNLGSTDTIVRRLDNAQLPLIGSQDVVPIEIVALHLVSVQPITVTYNGGQFPDPWWLEVDLSSIAPPPGNMTIRKTHANGGTFDSVFFVQPRFTFTNVTTPSTVKTLDTGVEGLPPIQLVPAGSAPWVYDSGPQFCDIPGCTTNFFPGLTPSYSIAPWVQQGPYASQGLMPACGFGPISTEPRSWGGVKALYRD